MPILIHGGRGLPPIADGLAAPRRAAPGRVADHRPRRDRRPRAPRRPRWPGAANVFFDTSTWSAIDLLDLYRRVPPEQVVYASDFPYGQQPGSLFIALRSAAPRRASTSRSCAACSPATRTGSPTARSCPSRRSRSGGDTIEQPLQLARIHQYLSMAMPFLWLRQPDTIGVLGLALNACAERERPRRDDDPDRASCSTAAATSGRRCPEPTDEAERFALVPRTASA